MGLFQTSNRRSELAVGGNTRDAFRNDRVLSSVRGVGVKSLRLKKSQSSPSNRLVEVASSNLLPNYGPQVIEMPLEPRAEAGEVFGNYGNGHEFAAKKGALSPASSHCEVDNKGCADSGCFQHEINSCRADGQTLREQGSKRAVYAMDEKQAFHSRSGSETSLFSTVECSSFSSRSETGSLTRVEPLIVGVLSCQHSAMSRLSSYLPGAPLRISLSKLNPQIDALQGSSIINHDAAEKDYLEFKILGGSLVESESGHRDVIPQNSVKSCSSYVLEMECGVTEFQRKISSEIPHDPITGCLKADTLDSPLLIPSSIVDDSVCCLRSDASSADRFTGSFKLSPEEAKNVRFDTFDFGGFKFSQPLASLKTDVPCKTLSSPNCQISEMDEHRLCHSSTGFTYQIRRECTTALESCPFEKKGDYSATLLADKMDSDFHTAFQSSAALEVDSCRCASTSLYSYAVPCSHMQKIRSHEKLLSGKISPNVEPVETQSGKFSQEHSNPSPIVRNVAAPESLLSSMEPIVKDSSETSVCDFSLDSSSPHSTLTYLAKDIAPSLVASGIRRKASLPESRNNQRSLSQCLMSPRMPNCNVPQKLSISDTVKGNANADSDDNIPAFKSNRCIPTPKIAMGSGKPRLATSKRNHLSRRFVMTECASDSSTVVQGHLHCVIRDGAPSYTLFLDGLDEVLMAETLRIESIEQDLIYVFYSCKEKRRGAGGWKNWRKKERSATKFLGSMMLTSKVSSEKEPPNTGKSDYVTLEFVFLGNDEKESFSSFSTSSPRESVSSQGSMLSQLPQSISPSPSSFTPRSENFDLLSPPPTLLGLPSPRLYDSPFSSHYISLSTVARKLVSPPATLRSSKLEGSPKSRSSLCSPISGKGEEVWKLTEGMCNDPLATQNTGMGCPNRSHLEGVAVVIRMPLKTNVSTSLGDNLSLGHRWGWQGRYSKKNAMLNNGPNECCSTNFGKAKENIPSQFQTLDEAYKTENHIEGWDSDCKLKSNGGKESLTVDSLGFTSETRENIGLGLGTHDSAAQGASQVIVTVILPNGNHGRPLNGMTGPQPLIDRWRSGGICDCGSWDLGCGLTILDSELQGDLSTDESFQAEDTLAAETKLRSKTLKMFIQAKKQEGAIMSLMPLQNGHFTLNFRSPLSALQAFATSIAVLCSMGPVIPISKQETVKVSSKPPRIPLQPLTTSVLPTSQEHEASAPWRRFYGEYSNPDPPLSPIERL
ncbi:hypothetical protein O6H91_14G044900 [Diphasiastrum complanatum]|uniref:Uncharacterized protein n=2 Tax=Diphasiastrum complanatum TaxID=34168 RepID=A0ACC2BPL4_DIPCM|nr:hypothetical protein O6H91_14G044900 [Diphasiastrum complanatum]KAJ7531459.1 hypothetical protein O6H91_14G044900 [Diphasiastrum complanatum]